MLKQFKNEKWIVTLIPEGLRVLPDSARVIVSTKGHAEEELESYTLEVADWTGGCWSVGDRRNKPVFEDLEVLDFWLVEPNLGEANMDGVSEDELRMAEYEARKALRAAASK